MIGRLLDGILECLLGSSWAKALLGYEAGKAVRAGDDEAATAAVIRAERDAADTADDAETAARKDEF
jgi:hypothetical protein